MGRYPRNIVTSRIPISNHHHNYRPGEHGDAAYHRRTITPSRIIALMPDLIQIKAQTAVRRQGFLMLRLLLILLCSLGLGACSGGDGALPADAASPQLTIGFPKGGLADTITVTVVDRLPLRAAELVAPDGSTVRSNWVNVASAPAVRTGQSIGNDPGTSLTGMSVVPILTSPDALANAALYGQTQLQAMVSQADIALPDPVAYKRDWVNYRVRLYFGTPPSEIETREIAAPEPPPQPAPPPGTPIPAPG
jgi:hypothetical protein